MNDLDELDSWQAKQHHDEQLRQEYIEHILKEGRKRLLTIEELNTLRYECGLST